MFTIAYSARYHVWFAARAVGVLGEYSTLAAADQAAKRMNSLL